MKIIGSFLGNQARKFANHFQRFTSPYGTLAFTSDTRSLTCALVIDNLLGAVSLPNVANSDDSGSGIVEFHV
ncbi:hypothetical protein SNOG_02979 [Parastagonospora nodorum SN15]|uniref:Uncharacterized protein n=1 Tax=Phaeosphaeria nodorum (strain SN15 / ATCC MYA-4574 / FGSC 10173) TaxID=321614 RepID=Q0UZ35_PHANO|nr:hypothetical protein SNOG_02979 [Parastagonospora nodorum SN15]EAT89710.1 hypothetical protein SNOG_02979 [Parastagonospora nodorum SN15]